jgi:hypothetical protein
MSEIEIQYKFLKLDKTNYTIKSNSSGFIINYNNMNHLVTVHHFYPLDLNCIYYNKEIKLEVFIRSHWNELLILNFPDNININQTIYKINNFRLIIPKLNEEVFISGQKITVIGFNYFPIGMIPGYPRVKIIEVSNNKDLNLVSGLPVFDSKSKIIGIVTKGGIDKIFVLPIIYLLKTLSKSDNINIFYIERTSNITKINRYNVKKNIIFTKVLQSIPIDCYFLIEGDKKKKEKIYENNTDYNLINYSNVTDKMLISLECEFVKNKDNNYKVNVALMKYLLLIKRNDVIEKILEKIKNGLEKELYLKITFDKKIIKYKFV